MMERTNNLLRCFLMLACLALSQPAIGENTPPPSGNENAPSFSSTKNYVGDCFKVYVPTPTPSTPSQTVTPGWYLTLSQEGEKLTLLKVKSAGFICSANDPEPNQDTPIIIEATADALAKYRARRTGLVYGALVLPYKYHFDDKSFSGASSIGPYVGRRSTLGDMGIVWAFTAGMTPLSVESVDANGNKKSTQLAAFTAAIGLMFELSKGASPLHAGIFYGTDIVSSTSALAYNHDSKPWLALQIGWNFGE